MSRLVLFALVALTLVSASAWAQAVEEAYVLGPEDVIGVTVLRHPELSQAQVVVLEDGTIDYPIAGKIKAEGLTTAELAARIAEGLTTELRQPEVTVTVSRPRQQRIYVDGAVGQPGVLDWKPGWRVSHAIAAAGGLTLAPDRCKATLFRVGREAAAVDLAAVFVGQDPAADLALEPGDSLHVASNTISVYVTGEVSKPGAYEVLVGSTARHAIALAGGLKDTAAPEQAYVMRGTQNIAVDLYRVLEQGDTSADVLLAPGDVVHVPENRNKIAVFGHVAEPGYYGIRPTDHLTVTKAIAMAGGTTPTAGSSNISVVRQEQGRSVTIPVDLRAIVERAQVSRDVELQPGDIILVPQSGKRTTRSVLSDFYGLALLQRLFVGL
jgi:polysaccharide export outer membrane protein